jgi:hypothetical protein
MSLWGDGNQFFKIPTDIKKNLKHRMTENDDNVIGEELPTKEDLSISFKQATAVCILVYEERENNNDDLVQAQAEDLADLQALLEITWGSLCKIKASGREGWRASTDHIGYLVRETSTGNILVPYHLADFFPSEDALDNLCRIASGVRVSDGVICLSGSSTFSGILRYISDLDYCEYAPFDRGEGWHDQFLNALRTPLEQQECEIMCLKGSVFNAEIPPKKIYTFHTPEDCQTQCFDYTLTSYAKLDFVTLYLEQVIKATNIVLPVDPGNPNDPTLSRSFAPQEAPIADGSWFPQRLLDPMSLGHCATWLKEEVREMQNVDLIKAAKRALSLSRITGFWEYGNDIIEQLNDTDAARQATLEEREALETLLTESNHPCRETFLNKLQETLEYFLPENPKPNYNDTTKLRRILTELLERITI